MAVLGIYVHKGFLRFALLEGTKSSPVLAANDRLATPDPKQVPALMGWYETQFEQLIDKYAPALIAYRLTLNAKGDQLFHSEFPLGVLNLIAHRRDLPVTCSTSRSLNPSKLNLGKRTDLYRHCDTVFGQNPPYWDDNQKHAVVVAWLEL